MRILVASGFEAESLRAHAINTTKMAQGFARLGHEVKVISRQSSNGKVSHQALAETYGLTEHMRWSQLPTNILGCQVDQHWTFTLLGLPIALAFRPDLVFSRNYVFPWIMSRFGIATVAESHAQPDNHTAPFKRLVEATRHKKFRLWVTISQILAEHYHSLGVPRQKLMVLPDAVDLQLFQRPRQLPPSPYPNSRPNVVYAGQLFDYKGIPTVLEAAARLPGLCFHLVGGTEEDIARHQLLARDLGLKNLTFHGLKPHSAVPPFLWHADILLLPPSRHHPSSTWTSPVKLGEYLASGTPVVATDIPALRDWLTDQQAEFVRPDDAEKLAEGIERLLADKPRAESLRSAGPEKARELSYERRAEAILRSLKNKA